MKRVPKFALALFTGVFVVVAVFTAIRVRSEIALFDEEVRRNQRIVGLTAGAALSKMRTREEAIRLARRVDASRESIRVRFVSLAPEANGALRSMSREIEAERLRTKREVEARIQALEQLRHADRLTTLGQLASVLAHEIGTPLNVIAGHGKLIASGRLGSDGISESAAAIGEQCARITRSVRRILDYARRRPARRTSIGGGDVVRQACALLQGLAEQRKVVLEFSAPSDEVTLLADPDQLQQAVTNLALNAIHASPANGRVRFVLENVTRTGLDGEQHFVTISVHDNGPGIPAELRERIFEPFFTTKPPSEGTGLGLSVVRDIVKDHGGFVDVSSGAGGGSVFTIGLPTSTGDVG